MYTCLAGVPARPAWQADAPPIRREVTLVLDRSGSMSGEKIRQVQEAARQVIGGLNEGEAFNIVDYSGTVQLFSPRPVIKTTENTRKGMDYVLGLQASGGTNIHSALTEALQIEPVEGMLPIVLFLTDGLATVGQTSEVAIRDVAMKANPHKRRIFTFGVGMDVNTPLLERMANETRAVPTFILPQEDVEVKVSALFKRLSGPILADTTLVAANPDGASCVSDVMPVPLPDLFEDDQLVVVGRYKDAKEIRFDLSGNYMGTKRTFAFSFPLDTATTQNAFVPRLWASRRIAGLIDAIRQLGAGGSGLTITAMPALPPSAYASTSDPRVKELVDEIVRLSLEFGILTEYTAFLAREGTDLGAQSRIVAEADYNLKQRAMGIRWGSASVCQSFNIQNQNRQQTLNYRNEYLDEQMNRVAISTVQQVNDKTFYLRKGRWLDAGVASQAGEIDPERTVAFASREYFDLAGKLAAENRQGSMAMQGDIVLMVDGRPVLIEGPRP